MGTDINPSATRLFNSNTSHIVSYLRLLRHCSYTPYPWKVCRHAVLACHRYSQKTVGL